MSLTYQQNFFACGSPEHTLPLLSVLVRGTRLTVLPVYYRQYQYLRQQGVKIAQASIVAHRRGYSIWNLWRMEW
jgi:hypothetical protein